MSAPTNFLTVAPAPDAPDRGADTADLAASALKPQLELPGPNRLLSGVADDLVTILNANPHAKLYRRDRIVVTPLNHSKSLMEMTPQCFCTWVEDYIT